MGWNSLVVKKARMGGNRGGRGERRGVLSNSNLCVLWALCGQKVVIFVS